MHGAWHVMQDPPGPHNNLLRLRSSVGLLLSLLLPSITLTLAVALLPVALLHDATSPVTLTRTTTVPAVSLCLRGQTALRWSIAAGCAEYVLSAT
jgi:hypothetical protein